MGDGKVFMRKDEERESKLTDVVTPRGDDEGADDQCDCVCPSQRRLGQL